MYNKEYYEIFKRSIAMSLKNMGNPIEDARVNYNNHIYVVYLFKKTNKLLKDLNSLNK